MSRLRKSWLPYLTQPAWGGGAATVTYTISGTVYDSDGTTAVASATVALGAYSATSAVDGTYTISAVPAGTSGSMTCTKAGYSWTAKTISAMSGNLTSQNYTNVWWALGGISANCLAAFQPKGAASAAAALVNLTGVTANDAANGAAYPAFDTATGWAFTAASSQYLTVSSGALATATPLTMVALFQASNVTSDYAMMSICRNATSNERFILYAGGGVVGDPVVANATQAGAGAEAQTTTGYTATTWYTAIGVFSAANARAVYLNGTNKGTNTTSKTPASLNATYIGCWDVAGTKAGFWGGKIAACAFYNIAASDAQAALLHTAMAALVA